jgi:hypothetical protein
LGQHAATLRKHPSLIADFRYPNDAIYPPRLSRGLGTAAHTTELTHTKEENSCSAADTTEKFAAARIQPVRKLKKCFPERERGLVGSRTFDAEPSRWSTWARCPDLGDRFAEG